MFKSFLIVLSILILLRLSIAFIGKQRRSYFTGLPKGITPTYSLDSLPLMVTVDQNYLQFRAKRNNRVLGKIVVGDGIVALGCAQGPIFRIENSSDIDIKILGPERMVMIGYSPSGEISIRVELSIEEEQELQRCIAEALMN